MSIGRIISVFLVVKVVSIGVCNLCRIFRCFNGVMFVMIVGMSYSVVIKVSVVEIIIWICSW